MKIIKKIRDHIKKNKRNTLLSASLAVLPLPALMYQCDSGDDGPPTITSTFNSPIYNSDGTWGGGVFGLGGGDGNVKAILTCELSFGVNRQNVEFNKYHPGGIGRLDAECPWFSPNFVWIVGTWAWED